MESDRATVEAQLGRPPRAFRRVVVRCPSGHPTVTEQSPYDENGEPFPTMYWLTCPELVAAVSRLEAAGGVEQHLLGNHLLENAAALVVAADAALTRAFCARYGSEMPS